MGGIQGFAPKQGAHVKQSVASAGLGGGKCAGGAARAAGPAAGAAAANDGKRTGARNQK